MSGHYELSHKERTEQIRARGVPSCTTQQRFEHWLEAARIAPPGALGFCADCTKSFQADAIRMGRCDHPELEVGKDEDEDL